VGKRRFSEKTVGELTMYKNGLVEWGRFETSHDRIGIKVKAMPLDHPIRDGDSLYTYKMVAFASLAKMPFWWMPMHRNILELEMKGKQKQFEDTNARPGKWCGGRPASPGMVELVKKYGV
jgi:mitochondrial fission protein ELM1